MELPLPGLDGWQAQETLYRAAHEALHRSACGPLVVNLRNLSFIPAERVLALVNVARWWYQQTGFKARLVQLQKQVHQYLGRTDLFTHGMRNECTQSDLSTVRDIH